MFDSRDPDAPLTANTAEQQKAIDDGIAAKKAHYTTEAKADKLGIWLSKDEDAAERMLTITANSPAISPTIRWEMYGFPTLRCPCVSRKSVPASKKCRANNLLRARPVARRHRLRLPLYSAQSWE